MEVAPSNGSGSESKPSGLSAGSENRTPNSRVLSPHVGGNAAMPGPGVTYKQWQYPGYSIQAEIGREGEAAASQPILYYYPPLQPGALGGGYQQQPYYYCNPTHSQPHALPQLQQASSQYPGPKVYQFPGFQEPQPQQAHVQQGALASPNTSSGQQQFPLRQFSPSPAPYQMNTTSITPLSYLGPQSGYEPTGQLLSSPNAAGSSARRPGTALKQGRRPVKQRDPLDLPQDLRMQSYDVPTASGQMTRPRVTTTMWEDEKTLCYQVEANGVSVVRRADNDMINGTKLLNVAKITRGRRDGILKAERIRHVVKIGSMHLKGVWIPFERAHAMAQREKIVDYLYPLFVKDIQSVLKQASSDVLEPLPPPASVIASQPLNAVLAPQQTQQEEDLANQQPQLSYDLAPAWYGNMSSRSHTSPQPYRNTLSYGQCQSMVSSSTTPPSFPAPLQPAFHQPLPAPAYHPDFGPSYRPHDGGSAASNSTSSSNASVKQALSSDAMLNARSSSRQETKAVDNNAKNNTPGKLLTGIQPPQPIVDGSELDDKAQDSQKQDA